jgi:hypothetical protein
MKTQLPAPTELDESTLGPAMSALNPQRRLFVIAKVHLGLNDQRAGKFAGYTAITTAWRVAHSEDVQLAIEEEGKKLLRSQGAASIRTVVEIRDDKRLDARDRLKAAIELMNRAGFHAISESHSVVEHKISESQMDKRILALAAELGMGEEEAKRMLIAPSEFKRNAQGVYVDPSTVTDAGAEIIEPEIIEAEAIDAEPGEQLEAEPTDDRVAIMPQAEIEEPRDTAFEASLAKPKRRRGRPRKISPLAGIEDLF